MFSYVYLSVLTAILWRNKDVYKHVHATADRQTRVMNILRRDNLYFLGIRNQHRIRINEQYKTHVIQLKH